MPATLADNSAGYGIESGPLYKTASYTLKPWETGPIHINSSGGSNAAVTLTLPAPGEAKGRVFTLVCAIGTGVCSFAAPNGALIKGTQGTADAAGDTISVRCDGTAYYVITSQIA